MTDITQSTQATINRVAAQLAELPRVDQTADQAAAARALSDQLAALNALQLEQVRLLDSYRPPTVLSSRLIIIPASGRYQVDSTLPAKAIVVINCSDSPMIIDAGTPGMAAPTEGVGVHLVTAYGTQSMPIGANGAAIWGTPGAQANVDLISRAVVPAGIARPT